MDKSKINNFVKATSYFINMENELEDLGEELVGDPKIIDKPILLPDIDLDSDLLRLIKNRRSKRAFENKNIPLDNLSKLLWGTQGITSQVGEMKLRAVASAGNTHPFNTYVLINRVEGIKQGLYFYGRDDQTLGLLRSGWLGDELSLACLNQKMVSACSVIFIWSAVIARTTSRYKARGYRYIYIDAGHLGAQIQLLCESMGLVSCNIAAFFDDELAKFLGLKSEFEIPVYLAAVGLPQKL